MVVITLNSLRFINWKGAIDQTHTYKPGNNYIYGPNGSGKSRQVDGLKWNLTGKDVEERTDYEIKNTTTDKYLRQDHVVINNMSFNGKPIEFKRTYKEKHVKKKGAAQTEFTGHETEYEIDGVSKTQAEYKKIVNDLIPEQIFKMLTNPLYFNTPNGPKWTWKDQRDVLIQMAGEITDDEILQATVKKFQKLDLNSLKTLLEEKSDLNEQIQRLKAKIKFLKEELEDIPSRIDEALLNRPSQTEEEFKEYEDAIAILKKRDEAIVLAMTEVQNEGKEIIEAYYAKKNEVAEIRGQANLLFADKKREYKSIFDNKESEKNGLLRRISNINSTITTDKNSLRAEEARKSLKQKDVDAIRLRFTEEKESQFVFDPRPYQALKCPTCGKEMKGERIDIEEIKAQQESDFNTRKASNVERLRNEAIEKANSAKDVDNTIAGYKASIELNEADIAEIKAQYDAFDQVVMPTDEEILAEMQNVPEYTELINKAANLESLLPEEPKPVDNTERKAERKEIETEKERLQKLLGLREEITKADNRKIALEERETTLSQQIADYENEIFSIEGFNKSKMELVQNRVNAMFENVSFKLFDVQVNGSVIDDCVLWYKDRPWTSLNTADKIWAGLECIKTFNKFYQIYAPIFIDNRESTTHIPKMECQVISLIVQGLIEDDDE